MLKQKNAASVLAHRRGKSRKEKYYMSIVSLKRAAVKLAIVASGVYTIAAVGQLQLVAAAVGIIVTNALCGLILKEEENHYEKI